MGLYETLNGNYIKQADKIRKHSALILDGTLVSIDPGSNSMGWAIYTKGELVKAGTASATQGLRIGERIQQIFNELPEVDNVDMVATELVRSSTGSVYMVWSNGAPLAKYGPSEVVEITTGLWKKIVPPDYAKSDVRDAKMIGKFVIQIAQEYQDEQKD